MKRIGHVALILMLLMVMAISGCGKSGSGIKSSPGNTGETVDSSSTIEPDKTAEPTKAIPIKLWIYPMFQGVNGDGKGEFDDWAKAYAAKFKETHPNANITVELIDWQGGTEKVDISVAAGSPPDLVYTINNFGGVTKFGKMGVLEPIDPYLTQSDWDDYPESVKGAMKVGDQTYLWPMLNLASGIAVNLDLFEEKKATDLLPLDRPLRDWTFDEFLKASQATTFSRSGGNADVYGFGLSGIGGTFYKYLFGVGNGGSLLDDNFQEVKITDPKFSEGMQFAVDLVNKYKVTPFGTTGLTSDNISELFLQQKVAMIPAGADIVATVKSAPKPFKLGFVAPPHGEGAVTSAWNNVGGFIVFKQSDEEKKKMVMEFAKFITNAENSKIVKALSLFPARKSAGNLYGDDEVMNYFKELSQYGNSPFSRSFGLIPGSEWDQELQAVFTGGKTVDQALQSLGGKLKESLEKK